MAMRRFEREISEEERQTFSAFLALRARSGGCGGWDVALWLVILFASLLITSAATEDIGIWQYSLPVRAMIGLMFAGTAVFLWIGYAILRNELMTLWDRFRPNPGGSRLLEARLERGFVSVIEVESDEIILIDDPDDPILLARLNDDVVFFLSGDYRPGDDCQWPSRNFQIARLEGLDFPVVTALDGPPKNLRVIPMSEFDGHKLFANLPTTETVIEKTSAELLKEWGWSGARASDESGQNSKL